MDVRQLTYFLTVVDHGGFTRAVEHLLVAQPSLSQTIKGLERELGVALFHRIGRRVGAVIEATTAAGHLTRDLGGTAGTAGTVGTEGIAQAIVEALTTSPAFP